MSDKIVVEEIPEENIRASLGGAAEKFGHFITAESKHKAIIEKADMSLLDIDEEKEDAFKMVERMVRLESVASRRTSQRISVSSKNIGSIGQKE
jgi:hypothetical protein